MLNNIPGCIHELTFELDMITTRRVPYSSDSAPLALCRQTVGRDSLVLRYCDSKNELLWSTGHEASLDSVNKNIILSSESQRVCADWICNDAPEVEHIHAQVNGIVQGVQKPRCVRHLRICEHLSQLHEHDRCHN